MAATKHTRAPTPDTLFAETFVPKPRKGDLMRFQMIEAAIPLIAEGGLSAHVFEQVAKALKVRRSHVVYYFKSKEELFQAVIRYILANAQRLTVESLKDKPTPGEQLDAIIGSAYQWALRYRAQAQVFLLFHFLGAVDPGIAATNREFRLAAQRRLESICGSAPKAQALHSLIIGLLSEALILAHSPKDLERALRQHGKLAREACRQLIGAE